MRAASRGADKHHNGEQLGIETKSRPAHLPHAGDVRVVPRVVVH